MLSKLNLNKLKEQKWLYFFVGSLFTALIAGGLVYFDVYSVLGRSTLRSDPSFLKAALEADSWAEIYGGIRANSTGKAESGLIVLGGYDPDPPISGLYGKVGIGFPGGEVPSEMLEVRGNVKVVDRPETTTTVERLISPTAEISRITNSTVQISDKLRLHSDGLDHLEDRGSGTYIYWAYGNCHCSGARQNETRLADARKFSLSSLARAIKQYVGSLVLPQAWAIATCYSSPGDCTAAGGTYCFDYGDSCAPGEPAQYDFAINCTSNPTADAQCNPGDTEVPNTSETYSCYGTEYVGKVQCQSTSSSGPNWYSKIIFDTSQTIIDDDLVADNNVLSNCVWLSAGASECPSGQIMAGYDGSRIKCCDL